MDKKKGGKRVCRHARKKNQRQDKWGLPKKGAKKLTLKGGEAVSKTVLWYREGRGKKIKKQKTTNQTREKKRITNRNQRYYKKGKIYDWPIRTMRPERADLMSRGKRGKGGGVSVEIKNVSFGELGAEKRGQKGSLCWRTEQKRKNRWARKREGGRKNCLKPRPHKGGNKKKTKKSAAH